MVVILCSTFLDHWFDCGITRIYYIFALQYKFQNLMTNVKMCFEECFSMHCLYGKCVCCIYLDFFPHFSQLSCTLKSSIFLRSQNTALFSGSGNKFIFISCPPQIHYLSCYFLSKIVFYFFWDFFLPPDIFSVSVKFIPNKHVFFRKCKVLPGDRNHWVLFFTRLSSR